MLRSSRKTVLTSSSTWCCLSKMRPKFSSRQTRCAGAGGGLPALLRPTPGLSVRPAAFALGEAACMPALGIFAIILRDGVEAAPSPRLASGSCVRNGVLDEDAEGLFVVPSESRAAERALTARDLTDGVRSPLPTFAGTSLRALRAMEIISGDSGSGGSTARGALKHARLRSQSLSSILSEPPQPPRRRKQGPVERRGRWTLAESGTCIGGDIVKATASATRLHCCGCKLSDAPVSDKENSGACSNSCARGGLPT
mmetsp:Transcript_61520/g.146712  ORF Transcript_61520/g.146712 Transcript_61520/m.146712 type:complete len:255 (+) Transcript_61520:621-1385(+)